MKSAVLVLAAWIGASAFASGPVTPRQWVCNADGYDESGHLRQVRGSYRSTRTLAYEDALRSCMAVLRGCNVRSCVDI